MDTITLLVELAQSVHHQVSINDLLKDQSDNIKTAFLSNHADNLKMQLADTDYFANESHVVQIT